MKIFHLEVLKAVRIYLLKLINNYNKFVNQIMKCKKKNQIVYVTNQIIFKAAI